MTIVTALSVLASTGAQLVSAGASSFEEYDEIQILDGAVRLKKNGKTLHIPLEERTMIPQVEPL